LIDCERKVGTAYCGRLQNIRSQNRSIRVGEKNFGPHSVVASCRNLPEKEGKRVICPGYRAFRPGTGSKPR